MTAVNSVAVVVLGDVGRSPRMQYHCSSLAKLPCQVTLESRRFPCSAEWQTSPLAQVSYVGYHGERCIDDVENNPRITQYLLSTPFAGLSRKLFLLYAPFKVVFQILQLVWILLLIIPRPTAYLVQNPPRCALEQIYTACLSGAQRPLAFLAAFPLCLWSGFAHVCVDLDSSSTGTILGTLSSDTRWARSTYSCAHLVHTRLFLPHGQMRIFV
jgi:hypothetical protein